MKSSQELFKELYNSLPNKPDIKSRLFSNKLYLIVDESNISVKFISLSQYDNMNKLVYCENIDYITNKLKGNKSLIHEFYIVKNGKVNKLNFEYAYKKMFKLFDEEYKSIINLLDKKVKVEPFKLILMGDKEHYCISLDVNKNKDLNKYLESFENDGVKGTTYEKVFKEYLSNKGYYSRLSFDSDREDFIMYINKIDLNGVLKDMEGLVNRIKKGLGKDNQEFKNKLKEEFIKQYREYKEVDYKGFRITYSDKFSKYLVMDMANVLAAYSEFQHAIKYLINEIETRESNRGN